VYIQYSLQIPTKVLLKHTNRFTFFSAKVLYRMMWAHFGLNDLKAVISVW